MTASPTPPNAPPEGGWRVHVLCAEWCGVCRDYRPFVQEQSRRGEAEWVWVDIETHSDRLGELDIDNFPTLLITQGGAPRFLGPVTPQPEVAERLLLSLRAGNRYALPEVQDLPGIVRALSAL